MEEKEIAALMLTVVLLRRHYGKATMAQRFFAPDWGPDSAYWTCSCAAGKATLLSKKRRQKSTFLPDVFSDCFFYIGAQ